MTVTTAAGFCRSDACSPAVVPGEKETLVAALRARAAELKEVAWRAERDGLRSRCYIAREVAAELDGFAVTLEGQPAAGEERVAS